MYRVTAMKTDIKINCATAMYRTSITITYDQKKFVDEENSIAYHIYCNNKKIFFKENLSIYNLTLKINSFSVYAMLCYGDQK